MKNLNETTKTVIRDLKDDLKELQKMDSNVEVMWKLEELQHQKAFKKSADLIRKSLKK